MLFTCKTCNAQFESPKEKTYCSQACFYARGKGSEGRRSTWLSLTCFACGKSFERRKSDLSRQGVAAKDGYVFCSNECYRDKGASQVQHYTAKKTGRKRKRPGGDGVPPNAQPETRLHHEKWPVVSWFNDRGYVLLYAPSHPKANAGGRIHEHRLVAWHHVGDTVDGMHVDHVNGDRSDNRWENLEVKSRSDHGKKTWASEGLGKASSFVKWMRENKPVIYEQLLEEYKAHARMT